MAKANVRNSGGYKNWSWDKQIWKIHSSTKRKDDGMTKITRLKALDNGTAKTKNNVIINYKWDMKLIPISVLAIVLYYFQLDAFLSIIVAFLFGAWFTLRKE